MDEEEEKSKKEEVDIKKNYPALPPNYVSITQLQERWLQRKQQEEERQKAQAESKNQDNLKPTKGFSKTPQNSINRDPRIEGRHVSDHQVCPRLKGKGSDAFARENGMDKNVCEREIGEGNFKKEMHGVEKGRKGGGKEHGFGKIKEEKDCSRTQGKNLSCNAGVEGTASVFMVEAVPEIVSKEIKPVALIRRSDGKTVKDRDRENLRENLSCNAGVEGTASLFMVEAVPKIVSKEIKPVELIRKSDGKTVKNRKNLRKNLSCNAGVEGTASLFMVEAVPEIVSKEMKPVEFIRKSDGNTVNDRENLRKNGDWRVKRSGRKSKVEELPDNSMKKEDLGVFRGKKAPINGDDDDSMVEVLLENKVKEGALLGSGHSKGSERFGGGEVERKWKKKTEAKKLSDSRDKNTLVEAMEKGMEDEVLTGYNGSSLQKERGGRKAKGYRHRESVAEDLGTKITESFRDLSFVDSRKSNVTSTMGVPERRRNYKKYTRYPVMQKPVDNRCVWVKKGEISATNVAEIDNSGPSKLESTGMDEDERGKEANTSVMTHVST